MAQNIARLLQLDDCLRRIDGRWTAQALAIELEVSERTVRYDLDLLRERLHAPIANSRSRGYHYSDLSWRLSTIPLTQGELFALILGQRMLAAYAGTTYATVLQEAINNIAAHLPTEVWLDTQSLINAHISFWGGAETLLNPDTWSTLETACRQQRRVKMRYYTASRDAESEREVDPYLLHLYRGTNPYIIGYCHNRQAIRWFRVDRIREISLSETHFERLSDFNPQTYLEQIFQAEAGSEVFEVQVWFDSQTAPYLRDRRWHSSQEVFEHPDRSLTLQFSVRGLNDVKRWVLGYGQGARALAPPELVAMIRNEIEGMQAQYRAEIHS